MIDLTPKAFKDLTGGTKLGRVPVTVTKCKIPMLQQQIQAIQDRLAQLRGTSGA